MQPIYIAFIFADDNELAKLLHNSYNNRRALRARAKNTLMATSKSFFGIRRGSTKSMTYSVYRGQQVTKDRVTSVANPQSSSQMDQRLRLVLVANAATKLKGLVNHSFEGVTYGETSVSTFRALNLAKDALSPTSWVPKGAGDCGIANFLVSKGSLGSIDTEFVTSGGEDPAHMRLGHVASSKDFDDDLKRWMTKNAIEEGDQLTFLVGFANGALYYYADLEGHYHSFAVNRLLLKFDSDGKLDFSGDNEGWSSEATDEGFRLVGPLMSFDISGETATLNTALNFTAEKYTSRTEYSYSMAGVILSRLDGNTWRRSTCRLAAKEGDWMPTYDDVLPSYLKSSASSNKYLNHGDDSTGIITG